MIHSQGLIRCLGVVADAICHARAGEILDLDSIECPAMPTLSGCLLGLPAVYLIDSQESGQAAASILSRDGQILYSLSCSCQVLAPDTVPIDQADSIPCMSWMHACVHSAWLHLWAMHVGKLQPASSSVMARRCTAYLALARCRPHHVLMLSQISPKMV